MKKSEYLVKIVNLEVENLHMFWTNWEISRKFSGKMWLMIILKVAKKQDFTLSLKSTFLEKPQEGSNWPHPAPPPLPPPPHHGPPSRFSVNLLILRSVIPIFTPFFKVKFICYRRNKLKMFYKSNNLKWCYVNCNLLETCS